jgi:hypothetical protein
VEYLLQFWRILGGEGPGPEATAKRIGEARSQKTAQAAIARAIYLGPAPATPGAEKWLKVAVNLQKYVERITKARPLASKLGGALADVAGAVQHAASSAASSATGAASAAASAVGAKAAELSTAVIPTPGDMVPSLLEIPASLARRVYDTVSNIVPGIGEKLKSILPIAGLGIGGAALLWAGVTITVIVAINKIAFKLIPRLLKVIL